MSPSDVDKLASVELGGLVYWLEKLDPFTSLSAEDRSVLFKRYSVRKLGLDHFFVASKFPEYAKAGNFMMNSNRYVPDNRTGFETIHDTEIIMAAKYR
jgi:hypothetical protein